MTISSKLRRLAVATLAVATASAGLIPLAAAPASAVAGFTFDRLAGQNRFDTARRIAVETFGTANTVLLARADLFPDALSGAYLAGSTDGGSPILLTEVNRIPQPTNEALATLGTQRVILLGGPAAISASVEAELRSRNFQVERIGGRDRFETSQQVAERLGSSNVGTVDGNRTAIVASGRNFPDALAGGPLAFASRFPSILTDTNTLPQPARNALNNLNIGRVFLLGGPVAVSGNVENQIREMGITVERFGGANRQATAVLIANTAIQRLGFDDTHINLARGDHFADALTGGPHSGDESSGGSTPGAPAAPIVLTVSPTILGADTSQFLTNHSNTLREGHIFGGVAAVSASVEAEAERAAGAGRAVVTVDQTTVEAGDTITGNVAGDPQRVFVSGCGLNERELTTTSAGDFSLVIPSTQPAGNCTLTFRLTFSDGSEELESINIEVTAPTTVATAAPELLEVAVVQTFTQPNAGGEPYDQTVVRFTFDEAVTGQALISADTATNSCTDTTPGCSTKFKLYRFDQRVGSSNPNRVYSGRTAQIDSNDTSSVLVTFGQAPTSGPPSINREVGPAELREITLGAVAQNAVRDSSNIPNPFGDAGLNALVFQPGGTVAPDLMDVTNFRPNFDTTRTLVDFVFDEPAVPTTTTQTGGGYWLILNNADGSKLECNFQQGPTGSTTNGSGTTTHTVSCPTVALAQITAASVARGFIDADTVGAVAPGSTLSPDPNKLNPLQAHPVSGDGATTRPDLVSATFFDGNINGTAANYDQVIYTFDEPVLVPTGSQADVCGDACFAVYQTDGNEVFGGSVEGRPTVRSGENDSQLIVTFPDGAINNATGASVREGSVVEAVGTGGVNRTNREDEVSVQGVTFSAGFTSAPDFVACELEVTRRDPISGNPTEFQLVFAFDEDVRPADDPNTLTVNEGPGPNPAHFYVYNAAGAQITPKTSGGVATTANPQRRAVENEVLLAGYQNQTDLQNIASCGVDEGAVAAEDDAAPNPIGYEVISTP